MIKCGIYALQFLAEAHGREASGVCVSVRPISRLKRFQTIDYHRGCVFLELLNYAERLPSIQQGSSSWRITMIGLGEYDRQVVQGRPGF